MIPDRHSVTACRDFGPMQCYTVLEVTKLMKAQHVPEVYVLGVTASCRKTLCQVRRLTAGDHCPLQWVL